MAALVSGPAESRLENLPAWKPYVPTRPSWHFGRCGHSGGRLQEEFLRLQATVLKRRCGRSTAAALPGTCRWWTAGGRSTTRWRRCSPPARPEVVVVEGGSPVGTVSRATIFDAPGRPAGASI
jgi:hypothetical protein